MRASRLVSLLLLLQTRGGMTASALAGELEVSVRTVYRDVEALSEAGVPIYAERGPRGGVRLVDGYRTRLTGLTEDEAASLFLSGMPGPASELGLGTVVAAARLKVLAALPPELRARSTRITERFLLDAPAWFRPAEQVPHLEALANAVWDERMVDIRYQRPDGVTARRIEPLGLVLKAGIWYVVARCEGQLRTYRVSRVVTAEPTPERFLRPPEFELGGFWADAVAAYAETLPVVEVALRVDPARMELLADLIGEPSVGTIERLDTPSGEPDGWTHIRFRAESMRHAEIAILGAGAGVQVLAPDELRERVVAAARGVLAAYGPAD